MLLNVSGVVRAGTDPELRFTPSGLAVCSVRAVASSAKKLDNGEWETTAEAWYKVTAFGELAEFLADKITKGKRFHLAGRHQTEEWETKEGEKRQTQVVIADMIFPFQERESRGSAPAQGQRQQAPAQESPWGPPTSDPWAAPTQGEEPPF